MLPIVRKHEYLIFNCVINGVVLFSDVVNYLERNIDNCKREEIDHAFKYIYNNGFIVNNEGKLNFTVKLNDELATEINDIIDYGLTRYTIDFGDKSDFKLWQSYRMDQVQLKFLKNPSHNQVGTYYYDDNVIIFASLKKDSSVEERLNYKDKFIDSKLFQWETMADISLVDYNKLLNSKKVYLFIRKVADENGITLPFIYVGQGELINPRKQVKFDNKKNKQVITYLFDIPMENTLPDYLQYDFGLLQQ